MGKIIRSRMKNKGLTTLSEREEIVLKKEIP